MSLSLIVPVYKEERNIGPFLASITPIISELTDDYEIIFSMDPSPDSTEETILKYRTADPRIKLLKFSRRFGQQMAILAGLSYSRGDAVVVIDVDLQDPPQLVAQMWHLFKEGWDVVLAKRRKREGETFLRILITTVGYWVINKITEVRIPANTGDFRLMSRRVVEEVVRLKECHGFLRGLVALVGFKQTTIEFDRPPRLIGETNYNRFIGSLRIGFDGVFCFSNYALGLSTKMGFLSAGTAILFGFVYLFLKLAGFPFPLGNPTIVLLVLFLGGIQLISVGILGEYIGRIYEEVKERPKFILDTSFGFEGSKTPHGTVQPVK
ncbi:MAG: glycosyltransferase [Verrucomicrobia bacterium]|nr:glycosyltransferase [Verrucomicrobiota bacterium]